MAEFADMFMGMCFVGLVGVLLFYILLMCIVRWIEGA